MRFPVRHMSVPTERRWSGQRVFWILSGGVPRSLTASGYTVTWRMTASSTARRSRVGGDDVQVPLLRAKRDRHIDHASVARPAA